jgi:hypothetical protein
MIAGAHKGFVFGALHIEFPQQYLLDISLPESRTCSVTLNLHVAAP